MPAMALACGSFSGSSVATGDGPGVPSGRPDAGDAAQDQTTADVARPDAEADFGPVCESGGTLIWSEDFEKLLGSKKDWSATTQPANGQPAEVAPNVGRNKSGGLVSTVSWGEETFAVQKRDLTIDGPRAIEFWFRSEDFDGNLVLAQLLGEEGKNIQLVRSGYELVLRQQGFMASWELGAYATGTWHRVLLRLAPADPGQSRVRVSVSVDSGVRVERELAYRSPGTLTLGLQLGSFAPEGAPKKTHFYDDASFWSCGADSTAKLDASPREP